MAIPPLVCSTPPPLEQCEDDKDIDDYDTQYELSQEFEDGIDYGFGGFSTYSNYSTTPASINPNHSIDINILPQSNIDDKEIVTNVKRKPDDNCEDLNLEIENISTTTTNFCETIFNEIESQSVSTSENCEQPLSNDITFNNNNSSEQIEVGGTETITSTDFNIAKKSVSAILETNSVSEVITEKFSSLPITDEIISEPEAIQIDNNDMIKDALSEVSVHETSSQSNELAQCSDDEFGNFEDFKECSNTVAVVIDTFNPWQSEETNETEFQATFGNFNELSKPTVTETEEDDFDDFHSNTEVKQAATSQDEVSKPSATSSLTSTAVIENVVYSIFEEELLEPESKPEGTLESLLGETWSHLARVEVRQPYMINWNSSISQKTLLKALCIDSRNILYVPKWSSNTPKYAANLCSAPLQPQKQSTLTEAGNACSETSPGTAGSWVDQSTTPGQECSYAEALLLDLEHLMATLDQMAQGQSALKISELLSRARSPEETPPAAVVTSLTAADLDMLEVTTKTEKQYSPKINVQPIRQISLPDTHIFTPSDSETPRSKTIHYDSGPTILMPDPAPADHDDFSDFQDFQETSPNILPNSTGKSGLEPTYNPTVVMETQVLEPIRIEPALPVVNWPKPGEINETFDDYTDFISSENNVTLSNDKINNTIPKIPETKLQNGYVNPNEDQTEDDFDTFQSAVPSNVTLPKDISNIQMEPTITSFPAPETTSFDKDDFFSSSFTNTLTSDLSNNFNSLPLSLPQASRAPQQTLQPLTINTQSSQKTNSGQILQPLSLESYSQINWPNPGMDLQDLSRFNPLETVPSLKNDVGSSSVGGSSSKHASPARQFAADDDGWGEFVSMRPKAPAPGMVKQPPPPPPLDDDEWSDFVCSTSVKPTNGLNTISFNVHTNQNTANSPTHKRALNQRSVDVPTLNYITPKSNNQRVYSDKHLNL